MMKYFKKMKGAAIKGLNLRAALSKREAEGAEEDEVYILIIIMNQIESFRNHYNYFRSTVYSPC